MATCRSGVPRPVTRILLSGSGCMRANVGTGLCIFFSAKQLTLWLCQASVHLQHGTLLGRVVRCPDICGGPFLM